jgi:hypothetical protein
MMIGTGRRWRLWIPQVGLTVLAGFAMVIAGCSSDTPTAPADPQSEPTIRRVAIDDTLGAVGGYVFDDMNQNGLRDEGEPGLEGLIVMLADASSMTQADTTDADGEYEFDDLEPGMYIVSAPVVEGWTNTTPLNVQVQVNAAEMAMLDHGLYKEETGGDTGAIDGTVFNDMNQNGMMDEGEMGLEGLTVGLVFPDDKTEGAKTDADGVYEFSDLVPDVYTVVAPVVEGWMLTTPDSVQTKVVADSTVSVVFGLYMDETGGETGSISGTVFDDMNQNGMMDEGEMGLEGLTVGILYGDGKTEGAKTDANGDYAFDELLPGDYTVIGPSVEGWMLTTPVRRRRTGGRWRRGPHLVAGDPPKRSHEEGLRHPPLYCDRRERHVRLRGRGAGQVARDPQEATRLPPQLAEGRRCARRRGRGSRGCELWIHQEAQLRRRLRRRRGRRRRRRGRRGRRGR